MGLDATTVRKFRVQAALGRTERLKQFSAEQLNSREEMTGQTLLIVAAMAGNKKTMEILLNIKGVNPNVADNKGLTPLCMQFVFIM